MQQRRRTHDQIEREEQRGHLLRDLVDDLSPQTRVYGILFDQLINTWSDQLFGTMLSRARQELHISTPQLGENAGYAASTISRIERTAVANRPSQRGAIIDGLRLVLASRQQDQSGNVATSRALRDVLSAFMLHLVEDTDLPINDSERSAVEHLRDLIKQYESRPDDIPRVESSARRSVSGVGRVPPDVERRAQETRRLLYGGTRSSAKQVLQAPTEASTLTPQSGVTDTVARLKAEIAALHEHVRQMSDEMSSLSEQMERSHRQSETLERMVREVMREVGVSEHAVDPADRFGPATQSRRANPLYRRGSGQ